MALTEEMIAKLRKIAAESTNDKARIGAKEKLEAEGISLTESKGSPSKANVPTKPKAERKKREPKAKGEPKPKYKVGDVLNHTYMDETYKVKILAVTGWTGDGHRYDIEFLDENLKPLNKFAKSYDDKLSRIPKGKADQPYDCDDLIAKAEQRKAKAKANAIKRASEPKKTQATKNVEAVDRTAERVEKNVEKRVGKGEVSVAEIDKIIAEYETALTRLRALREKATSKMAKGGGVDAEEVEHILMKAKGVKEHHCGCGGSKMANGGSTNDISAIFDRLKKGDKIHVTFGDAIKRSNEATLLVKSKNIVGKGKPYESEKITFDNVANPSGVKYFAYKRKSGFVGFAMGDMAISNVVITMANKMATGGGVGERYFLSEEADVDGYYYIMDSQTNKKAPNSIFERGDMKGWGKIKNKFVKTRRKYEQSLTTHQAIIMIRILNEGQMAKGGKLIGKQANLDRNKNGRIDSEDLRMIRQNKMANGGGVGEKTIVYGKYRNNNTDDSYLFSSESKGLNMLTNHKNIDVISVGQGKYDLFYGWDDDKQKYGTLYFGKWNNGNFGYPYYGKVKYAKGGGVGSRSGINRKYSYFAVDKKDNKIVDAWELVDDVVSLKYYAKQDLIDNDRNPKDFGILSKKYLIAQGIDPFNKSNWKN